MADQEYTKLFTNVPSHRKLSGHVHYLINTSRSSDSVIVGACEKRHSEIKVFKESIEKLLGNTFYGLHFMNTPYPSYGGMMGTTSKINKWIMSLINLFNTIHDNKNADSMQKQLYRSMIISFLNLKVEQIVISSSSNDSKPSSLINIPANTPIDNNSISSTNTVKHITNNQNASTTSPLTASILHQDDKVFQKTCTTSTPNQPLTSSSTTPTPTPVSSATSSSIQKKYAERKAEVIAKAAANSKNKTNTTSPFSSDTTTSNTPTPVIQDNQSQNNININKKKNREEMLSNELNRLMTKTTATHLPYATMRFTAFGRLQYAFHAILYFITAISFSSQDEQLTPSSTSTSSTMSSSNNEKSGDGSEDNDTINMNNTMNTYIALFCLIFGCINLHACFSEERSPFFFQCISVISLWINFIISFINIECLLLGVYPMVPFMKYFKENHSSLKNLTEVEVDVEYEYFYFLFFIFNIIIVIGFYRMDTSILGLKKGLIDLWNMDTTISIVSFLHGLFIAFPILIANINHKTCQTIDHGHVGGVDGDDHDGSDDYNETMNNELILTCFRHFVFMTAILNLSACSRYAKTLSHISIHVLHTLPFSKGTLLISDHVIKWPFSLPISCLLFIFAITICRYPHLVEKNMSSPASSSSSNYEQQISKIHDRLRSGSMFNGISTLINGIFFLLTLLIIQSSSPSSSNSMKLTIEIKLFIFILGFSNIHATLSTKRSHWTMAFFCMVALFGNLLIWSYHLYDIFLNGFPNEPTSTSFLSSLFNNENNNQHQHQHPPSPPLNHQSNNNDHDLLPLSYLCQLFGFPLFETYIIMVQINIINIILLFLQINFIQYEIPILIVNILQGRFIILTLLRNRLLLSQQMNNSSIGNGGSSLGNGDGSSGGDQNNHDSSQNMNSTSFEFDMILFILYIMSTSGMFINLLNHFFIYLSCILYLSIIVGFYKISPLFIKPIGWQLSLHETLAMTMISLFILRFKHLLKPKQKND